MRSQRGPVKQQEILLISQASFGARARSAIGRFMRVRNSKKQNFGQKLNFPRSVRNEPGAVRKPPQGFPAVICQLKTRRAVETWKFENPAIRAVSWHLRGFQKPTGPPLSGRRGASGCFWELSYMVRSTLPPLRLLRGPFWPERNL